MLPSKPQSNDPQILWKEASSYAKGNNALANTVYGEWLKEASQQGGLEQEARVAEEFNPNEELYEDYGEDFEDYEGPPSSPRKPSSPRNLSLSDILNDKNEESVRPSTPEYGKKFFDENRPLWESNHKDFEAFLKEDQKDPTIQSAINIRKSGKGTLGGRDTAMACHHGACIYNDMMSKDKILPKLLDQKNTESEANQSLTTFRKNQEYKNYLKQKTDFDSKGQYLKPGGSKFVQGDYISEAPTKPKGLEELENNVEKSKFPGYGPALGYDSSNADPNRFIYPEGESDKEKISSLVDQFNTKRDSKEIEPLDRLFFLSKQSEEAPSKWDHVTSVRGDGSLRSQWTHPNNAISLQDLLQFAAGKKGDSQWGMGNPQGLPSSLYVAPRKSGFLK